MDNPTDRPIKTRVLYTTMELCKNKTAGVFGSLELIVSAMDLPQPTYHYWPLTQDGSLDADQLTDLIAVLGKEVSQTLVTRLMVQEQLFKSL